MMDPARTTPLVIFGKSRSKIGFCTHTWGGPRGYPDFLKNPLTSGLGLVLGPDDDCLIITHKIP